MRCWRCGPIAGACAAYWPSWSWLRRPQASTASARLTAIFDDATADFSGRQHGCGARQKPGDAIDVVAFTGDIQTAIAVPAVDDDVGDAAVERPMEDLSTRNDGAGEVAPLDAGEHDNVGH